ncbi:hypothetical protein [Streptomyces sp. NPDC053367]|uniref:hypothetical protein n=1 Tax=Streptomyces sp. NPDC053367 TaxID=3365700 RepID=UPI0037D4BDC1
MTEAERQLPVAMVNRYVVRGDPAVFERERQAYARQLCARDDFLAHLAFTVPEEPGAYVALDYWSSVRGFFTAAYEEGVGRRHWALDALADVEVDQMRSVGRMRGGPSAEELRSCVLLQADVPDSWREFELAFGTLVGHCVNSDGFGGGELLRSTLRGRRYLGVLAWRDEQCRDAALAGPGYSVARHRIGGLATLTTYGGSLVACEVPGPV